MNYWWVNQNKSYKQEFRAEILWAPLLNKGGNPVRHWETMENVRPGDVVFHYYHRHIAAVSDVTVPAVNSRRPADLPSEPWNTEGRLVRTTYRQSDDPVGLDEIPEDWRRTRGPLSPFHSKDSGAKQGYLFLLNQEFGDAFFAKFGSRFPPTSPLLPQEAMEGAANLLRRLVGEALLTPDGHENRILAVSPPNVVVATDRSPNGQPVPIEMVDTALNILQHQGSVAITPEAIGHRSAFVGAVLLTLPGAGVSGSPPVLSISTPVSEDDDADSTHTFEGDLDLQSLALVRGEQPALRRNLLGDSNTGRCAICGETYPVNLLVTAHIKRRSVCSDDERRDFSNIAMAACVFGCDALFEKGFIAVDPEGHIVCASADPDSVLGERLASLDGKGCRAHTSGSATYFDWHRSTIFRQE